MADIHSLFKRYYTKDLENNKSLTVFDLFQWKKVDVLLKDYKTGKTLTEMKDLEFPAHYSQNSCDIIASKYFRRAGVPTKSGAEESMRMVADRLVSFWRDALIEEGIIKNEEQKGRIVIYYIR